MLSLQISLIGGLPDFDPFTKQTSEHTGILKPQLIHIATQLKMSGDGSKEETQKVVSQVRPEEEDDEPDEW